MYVASKKWHRDKMSFYVSKMWPLKLDSVQPLGMDTQNQMIILGHVISMILCIVLHSKWI